jgi:hypothetical protein
VGRCRQEHDLVAIGSQECSYKEPASASAHHPMAPGSSPGVHTSQDISVTDYNSPRMSR